MLRNFEGQSLVPFSKYIGIKDSNEAEIVAIIEALRMYACFFQKGIFDVTSPMLSLGHREWLGVLGHLISIFMK